MKKLERNNYVDLYNYAAMDPGGSTGRLIKSNGPPICNVKPQVEVRKQMKFVYMDTETTDLKPGSICQLTYIVENGKSLVGKNFFFEVDKVEPEAEEIHGFSVETLRELSGGLKLQNIKFELLQDLDGALIVGHNVGFDIRFVNHELGSIHLNNKEFCTMSYFTDIIKIPGYRDSYKWPRLGEVIEFLNITDEEILKFAHKLFGTKDISPHDGRYDAAATYLIYKKGLQEKLIPKNKVESETYLKKQLERKPEQIARVSSEYKSMENMIIHRAIEKYFEGARNITEVDKKTITFKWDKRFYEACIASNYAVEVNSRSYKENGLLKNETYHISRKQIHSIIFEDIDYAEILSLFWELCCWLNDQKGKASRYFPSDLDIIMSNIELRHKAKEIGLIFYGSGWGWRLRKNWEDNLQNEYERYYKRRTV